MAINFLNTVNLNSNQLNNAVIQNLGSDPNSGVEGQIYFNTGQDQLRIYANGSWGDVGGGITSVIGSAPISASILGQAVTVTHDAQSRTDDISAASPGYGDPFTVIDSITATAQGHLSQVNTKTVTLPALQDTTYSISTTSGTNKAGIRLTPSGIGSNLQVDFEGISQEITIQRNNAVTPNIINIGLPDNVVTKRLNLTGSGAGLTVNNSASVGGGLTVTGASIFSSQVTVPNANSPSSAPNLGQVQGLINGQGGFQGSYDANTNTPALQGSSNVASANGDYYAVSVGGDFFGTTVYPGDFIYADGDIPANDGPTIADYTLVQSVSSIAAAGASDGTTTKGNAGFDSENFTVTNQGWVQLRTLRNPYGASVELDSALSYVQVGVIGGITTYTVNADDAAVFGTGADAKRIKAEIIDSNNSWETVYAQVTRASSGGNISFRFTGTIAEGAYYVLLTYVGDSASIIA